MARYETGDEDNFSQCGEFFRRVLKCDAKERLTDNIAGNLVNAQEFLQDRVIANFAAADKTYGKMVKDKVLRLRAQKAKTSSAASSQQRSKI